MSPARIRQRGVFGIGGWEAHCRVTTVTTMTADESVMVQPKEPKVVDHAFSIINLASTGDATVTCSARAAK